LKYTEAFSPILKEFQSMIALERFWLITRLLADGWVMLSTPWTMVFTEGSSVLDGGVMLP
jgi:hypothetical protein